ncbi:hypothetical protein JQX13_14270 [Archangium violaceum]|uniref:hypothetical protein n=1 Tax=Archangium violaceum TaxID=83451 RepID=UPI00193B2632|nr:hypothetical protein [Archangium violaceum]QRK11128.1 hypothetical protein JQX13_14270 [Archangium violaceum]
MNLRAPSLRQTLLSAATLAVTACGGGEGASLRFSVNESQSAQAARALVQGAETPAPLEAPTFRSSDGVTFTLTEARIHLKDIRLELPQGTKCAEVRGLLSGATCKGGESGSGSGTVLIPGPLIVDLMTGTTLPDLSGLRLPAGTYKRIDFRLDKAKAEEVASGEPLVGYSLRVKARFTRDDTDNTLELKLGFSEDARFESATGVEVGADDALLALLAPQAWLEGLPVATCLEKGDLEITNNVLLLDDRAKGDCSGAEDTVKRNIKNSGDLRKARD